MLIMKTGAIPDTRNGTSKFADERKDGKHHVV